MRATIQRRLADARAEAQFAVDLATAHGAAIAQDPVLSRALARACEIIGEALRSAVEMEPTIVADHPGVPWKAAIGLRTRLAHAYDRTDMGFLIETAQTSFPSLIAAINAAIGSE